jgi:hypothetical protein
VRKLSAQSARNCVPEYGEETFRKVRDALRAFDEPELRIQDYEEAGRMSNRCHASGHPRGASEFLICAVAQLRNWELFTTERDFIRPPASFYRLGSTEVKNKIVPFLFQYFTNHPMSDSPAKPSFFPFH